MKYCTACKSKYDDAISFCPVDGEVLEDDPTSMVGASLDGQYKIEALLGRGGMGAVYKARHILLGDQVAIKVLPPQMRNNAEWLRRFQREGQAARRFRHPNSVTVYDLRTTSDGLIYLVMEYVEGHTLDAELKRRGRLSPTEAFALLEPIMSVLNAAHAVGVVHRDLKPENIMIGNPAPDGSRVTKLLDLGIAKMSGVAGSEADSGTALTVAGQILGTPFYMSPEQWGEMPRDDNPEIDGRADIYSLAAVFYELVSGRRPFEASTLQEVRRVHVIVSPKELSEIVPGVTEGFSTAVNRAMAKDRSDRPATMAEFSNQLREALGLQKEWSQNRTAATDERHEGAAAPTGSMNAAATVIESPVNEPARRTNSDVAAPTVVTMGSEIVDQSTTPKPGSPGMTATVASLNAVPAPTPVPSPPTVSPTNAQLPLAASNQPTGQIQVPSHHAAVPPKKSNTVVFIIAAIALIAVVGVGGSAAWWFLHKGGSDAAAKGTAASFPGNEVGKGSTGGAVASTDAAGTDVLHYWIEPTKSNTVSVGSRLTENPSLGSGDTFRFHFSPEKQGFLYIVGIGSDGKPVTFLTAKPVPESGVKTNRLIEKSDFVFPQNGDIGLDKKPGTEVYTVIFSETPLIQPAFLDGSANRELNSAERAEYDSFVSRFSANRPSLRVNNKDQSAAYVAVQPNVAAAADPLVFQVQLQHK